MGDAVPTTKLAEEALVPEPPALAPGVALVGEFQGSGFAEPQWLVRRGQKFVQLTELLYRVAEAADGSRSLEEIAAAVTDATEWLVSEENVRELIISQLMPLGLIAGGAEAAAPTPTRAAAAEVAAALALRARVRAIGPGAIDAVARVLQCLYWPPILVLVLAVAGATHYWLYAVHGWSAALIDALYTPSSLLVVIAVVLAAAVFHEFGHASALRYGGGRARGMGAGLYLIFPAFYTDVTESYRLGRWARVRTGLGGPYFHLLFAVALIGIAYAFGFEFLLLAVLLINLEIVRQFIPFVRLDGYWVLADLTGLPDFFSQIGPFFRSLSPRFGEGSRLPPLKRWVRVVFAAYIAVTIPLLVVLFVLFVKFLPRVVTIIWDAVATQVNFLRFAASLGDSIGVATALVELVILALPVLGLTYLLYTLTWKPIRAVWAQPTRERRILALAMLATITFVVGAMWAPDLPFAKSAAPAGVMTFDIAERFHTNSPVEYPQSPPAGGAHAPQWQNCGFYATPIRNENGVHSLEHGAVWVTYRPGLPERDVEKLRVLARGEYVLVSPFPGLRTPLVASAWGRQLTLGSANDARLQRFVDAFRGDERAPEAGGPCTGGKGAPR